MANTAIGYLASATSGDPAQGFAVALGYNAVTTYSYAIALGAYASGHGVRSIGIGVYANSANAGAYDDVISIGYGANNLYGARGIAIGKDSSSTADCVAIGTNAATYGSNSISIGYYAGSSAIGSPVETIQIGSSSNASGNYGICVGYSSVANTESIAVGNSANADIYCMAIGKNAIATDTDLNLYQAIAIGESAVANKTWSTAIGNNALARGIGSVAIGANANTSVGNSDCTAIGVGATTTGPAVCAIGTGSSANNYATVIGAYSTATNYATVIGAYSAALQPGSVVLGTGYTNSGPANPQNSIIIGYGSSEYSNAISIGVTVGYVAGDYDINIGYDTSTSWSGTGNSNIAIGRNASRMYGSNSIAIGHNAKAYDNGVAIGYNASAAANKVEIGNTSIVENRFHNNVKIDLDTNTSAGLTINGINSGTQTGNYLEVLNSAAALLTGIRSNGSFKPAHMTNTAAGSDSIFYSTTGNKLAYKDTAGVVNYLY
jgi:hypothetical protein